MVTVNKGPEGISMPEAPAVPSLGSRLAGRSRGGCASARERCHSPPSRNFEGGEAVAGTMLLLNFRDDMQRYFAIPGT